MSRSPQGYRIAHFTNTYLPFIGGVPLSVDLYRRHLQNLGDAVIVYAPRFDGDSRVEKDVRRLPSIKQVNGTDFSIPLPFSFKPVIDFGREAFDVVHVHHPFLLGEMGMRLARDHRLPLVFTYHTQYERYVHYAPLDQQIARRAIVEHAAEFASRCDLTIAPTSDIERMLRERGVETDITVLPTGIELALFETAQRGAGRADLGVPPDAPVVVTVGRMAEEKNLPFLLSACLRLLETRPDAYAVFVGAGPAEEALRKQVEAAGTVGARVVLAGARSGEALRNAYAAGDLFVFASTSETQGMVVVEAMAAGLPVVALNADGVRELVRDGENGRLLAADCGEEAFTAAMRALLEDTGLRLAMGLSAKETARELDMPLLARRLHAHYAELKLRPNHSLRRGTMSFGLIRHYFESAWEEWERWLREV